MSKQFFYAESRDQAIIAKVIAEASQVANNAFLGRTAIQKILYFLQRLDVPVSYKFDLYHYGPFCSDIYSDVEFLMADDIIADKGKGKYSNYSPSTEIEAFLENKAEELDEHSDDIREVVAALAPFDPTRLELMATLDYLFQQEEVKKPEGPWKERVIDRFLQVKSHFNKDDVEKMYDVMATNGLIKK